MSGETTPLTGGSGGRSRSSGGGKTSGAAIRRSVIALAAVSAALLAVTVTFQLKLRSLSAHLASERTHLTDLQNKVDNQQSVIDRFSDAVSNKDVLKRVSDLEDDMRETEKDLTHKLFATQQSIEDLLNATLTKLDTTVKMAQDEIQAEVDKVKHDVNDYVIQTQDQFSMENSFMVYQLAGTFTLLASLISMWHMTAHLRRFNQPFVQVSNYCALSLHRAFPFMLPCNSYCCSNTTHFFLLTCYRNFFYRINLYSAKSLLSYGCLPSTA